MVSAVVDPVNDVGAEGTAGNVVTNVVAAADVPPAFDAVTDTVYVVLADNPENDADVVPEPTVCDAPPGDNDTV
jgi:hypothetical protein